MEAAKAKIEVIDENDLEVELAKSPTKDSRKKAA
jgi:hypothetical protein